MYRCRSSHYQNWNRIMVVDYKIGDVTGDRIPDYVWLVGEKTSDSPFVQNITLIIQDGWTGRISRVTFKNNAGYDPKLFLGDFTGDGVLDIKVTIASGGSGGYYFNYIYSAVNNRIRKLFDFDEFNDKYKFEVNYLDGYKVQVISKVMNEEFILDITYKGQDYLDELYDSKGNLIKPVQGTVYGLVALYPVDVDNDDVYELQAWQRITGLYNADGLGYVLTLLRWEEDAFEPYEQLVAIFGSEID